MPTYNPLLEEFRALSIARAKDNAPVAKQQKELVERLTGSLERCPPGQAKAGCESSNGERETIGKQLAELSKSASSGTEQVMSVHRRMEAAEKALPGYQAFTTRRNTAARRDRPLRARGARRPHQIIAAFPEYAALTDPKPLAVCRGAGAAEGRRGDGGRAGRLGAQLRVGRDARARRMGRDRRQQRHAGRARAPPARRPRPAGPAERGGLTRQPRRPEGRLRPATARTSSTSWCWARSPAFSRASAT